MGHRHKVSNGKVVRNDVLDMCTKNLELYDMTVTAPGLKSNFACV